MPRYFCDHGAYATVLGTTPNWGVPQEGDGSGIGPAAASSTAAITFAANAIPGNTVTVCGIVFTAVASGASGSQFNVGATLSATLDNLVTIINGNGLTVAAGVAVGTPRTRDLVYSRNTGGTTLEVMMRIGSATLNGAVNANCRMTVSGWATSTSLPVDFAGGSGGCWGYLLNTAAMGTNNSYAALAYGLMVMAAPLVAASEAAPTVSALPAANDATYVRTGDGFTLVCPVNTVPNLGAHAYPQNLVIDSNTVWNGDSGTGQITISLSMTSSDSSIRMAATGAVSKSIRCLRRHGLRIYWSSTTSGLPYIVPHSGSRAPTLIDGVIFETPATFTAASNMRMFGGSVFVAARFKRCSFVMREARTSWSGLVLISGIDGSLIFEGCEVQVNHTAGADPGPVCQSTGLIAGAALRFVGCSFSGWAFGRHRVFSPGMTMGAGTEAVAEGCTGINLGTTYAGVSAGRLDNPNYATVVMQSLDAGLGYRYEYGAGVVDWNPDASPAYPTRSALLGDNVTPWAVKLDWFASTVNVANNLITPRMASICRLSSATRTVSLDFLTPVAVSALDVAMRVHYVSTDGKAYCDSTFGDPAALTSPGATWDGLSNYPSHSSRRLSLTTSQPVKQGTEVAVYFEATGAPPGGTGVQLFVDPEVSIT